MIIYNSNNVTSNGTVWGNHFMEDHVTGSSYAKNMKGADSPAGITVSGSGNLIYNNYFAKGTYAISPDHDIYTGNYPVTYSNDWNLSEKKPVNYSTVSNGLILTGSIVDSGFQGGNFWSQAISQTPYNSSGKIAKGGDYYPLTQLAYPVTFNGLGLPGGIEWSVSIDNGARCTLWLRHPDQWNRIRIERYFRPYRLQCYVHSAGTPLRINMECEPCG